MEKIMILKAELSEITLEKIEKKQGQIDSNENLHEWGYIRYGRSRSGKQTWINLSFASERKRRVDIRQKDRVFFDELLGKVYMKNKVIHHKWERREPFVYLVGENEHPNGGKGKYLLGWKEREKWIQ